MHTDCAVSPSLHRPTLLGRRALHSPKTMELGPATGAPSADSTGVRLRDISRQVVAREPERPRWAYSCAQDLVAREGAD
jgi:hypothetical protein